MAATVINALTNVTLANDNTGFTTWKRDGTGGAPSAISEADVFIQGTGSCSVKVSNQGVALAYGTGGLDLSAANTHVYIWANMLAGGLMKVRDSTTVPGLAIIVSSDATMSTGSNYKMWAVDGSDTYPGGWVRYVIDLSKTASTTAGTLNLSSVRHIGMYCNTQPNTAKFDNLVIDRIDYSIGPGLRVYGTSTTDDLFQDILDADEGTVNNKYGIVTSKGGIIYCRGRIELGDDVSTNAATLTDVDRVVVWEDPRYYDGTADASCVSATLYRLDFVGNGTGATSITLGKKVGTGDTASGRNGLLLMSAGPNVTMDFDDGNVNTAKIYGSELRNILGTIQWGTDTSHEGIGITFNGCAQFDPVGGPVLRACNFVGTVSTTGALLWNSSIDIKKSNFLANTTGEGVEHDTIISVKAFACDGAGSSTVCTKTGEDFLTSIAVNDYVYNETDGSYAKVTSVDSNIQFTCDGLTGGSDNTFTNLDNISVSPAVTYTDLNFSGNTSDVTNSATGSDALFVSKSGASNPSTSTGTVVFIGSVPLTITVKDAAGDAIEGAVVGVSLTSDRTSLLNDSTNASGVVSTSYTGSTPVEVKVWIRKASSADNPRYKNYSSIQNISASGLTLDVTLVEDPNNNATT